jgi:hypothetical protein
MMWDNKEWADVNIRVADGKATVNFRGYDVIDNVPIDLAPIEAAQFLFAARTGGANQKHYIDDIKIRLFDSSSSRVTVAYDGGEPVTLLELTSRTPTAYDETVSLKLDNPEGAKTAVVVWDYQGYDNWWAVDNITVAADIEPEPTLAGLATDKGRYVIGEPVTVSFIGGPGNPRDWIGIYRPDMTPGEQGSLAWKYVSGSTIAGDGLSDGSVTFANHLPVGSYVARFFRNDGYSQLADAVAFTVGDPPGVVTDRLHYAPGEAITVRFTNGPGKPVGLDQPHAPRRDEQSRLGIRWRHPNSRRRLGQRQADLRRRTATRRVPRAVPRARRLSPTGSNHLHRCRASGCPRAWLREQRRRHHHADFRGPTANRTDHQRPLAGDGRLKPGHSPHGSAATIYPFGQMIVPIR